MTTALSFLALVADTYNEVGHPGAAPVSIDNQSGRSLDVITHVRKAWLDIQRSKRRWKWMRQEAQFNTVATQNTYSLTEIGADVTTFPKTALSHWRISTNPCRESGIQCYDPNASNPFSTRRMLRFSPYGYYYNNFKLHNPVAGQPTHFTFDKDNSIILFGTSPDKPYTIVGEYYHRPWQFTDAAELPDLPDTFHRIISLLAIKYYAVKENAPELFAGFQLDYDELWRQLEADQADETNDLAEEVSFHYDAIA